MNNSNSDTFHMSLEEKQPEFDSDTNQQEEEEQVEEIKDQSSADDTSNTAPVLSEDDSNLAPPLSENIPENTNPPNVSGTGTGTSTSATETPEKCPLKASTSETSLTSQSPFKEPSPAEVIAHQKSIIDKQDETLQHLDEKVTSLEQVKKELEHKLEIISKQKDYAIREKESMVIKFAISEKNLLEQTELKEQIEKKYKDTMKENEIMQHKVQTMGSEKNRICQMLDNKCYELKNVVQELDKCKTENSVLDGKLKKTLGNLKFETEAHKECQAKIEQLSSKINDSIDQVLQAKREAQESIKAFQHSQENRAYVLDQQVKEQQANLILLKHERDDKEKQVKSLHLELERLQSKQNDLMQENNDLSQKVQQLERERLESQQKLSELRGYADKQRQDAADLQAKVVEMEQLKLQLNSEHDQLDACKEQMNVLKQRNSELESDMEACRTREAELLIFTQQLTDKNVRLQSEFTSMETKVQQLTCEQTLLKRSIKEQETRANMVTAQLAEDRLKYLEETEQLSRSLEEMTKLSKKLQQEVNDQKGENVVVKRKFDLQLREVNKELQHCRKRIEQYESMGNTSSCGSSNSSSAGDISNNSPSSEQVKVIQPDAVLDRQTLIEHIVKLQRISAKKSEKLDFLEEHVNTLCAELQKKSRLLQTYILREQSGTMTSNKMDKNKAQISKLTGIMASVYSSRVADDHLTLELSLDINRKLQAVLEDALLKNITLKENVDTLGKEIERLNSLRNVC